MEEDERRPLSETVPRNGTAPPPNVPAEGKSGHQLIVAGRRPRAAADGVCSLVSWNHRIGTHPAASGRRRRWSHGPRKATDFARRSGARPAAEFGSIHLGDLAPAQLIAVHNIEQMIG